MQKEKIRQGFDKLDEEVIQRNVNFELIQSFYADIKRQREKGHSWEKILKIFTEAGLTFSESTLRQYFGKIDKTKIAKKASKAETKQNEKPNVNNVAQTQNNVAQTQNNVPQTQNGKISVTATASVKKPIDNSHLQKIITDPVTGKQMLNPAMRIRPEDI